MAKDNISKPPPHTSTGAGTAVGEKGVMALNGRARGESEFEPSLSGKVGRVRGLQAVWYGHSLKYRGWEIRLERQAGSDAEVSGCSVSSPSNMTKPAF